MARYLCDTCGTEDDTGLTYYYVYVAMGLPTRCATCDPNQRCHFHHKKETTGSEE